MARLILDTSVLVAAERDVARLEDGILASERAVVTADRHGFDGLSGLTVIPV